MPDKIPAPVQMSVREHLRGGYKEVMDRPHIVVNGDHVGGVWLPGLMGIELLMVKVALPDDGTHPRLDLGAQRRQEPLPTAVPKPSARKPRRKLPNLTTRA